MGTGAALAGCWGVSRGGPQREGTSPRVGKGKLCQGREHQGTKFPKPRQDRGPSAYRAVCQGSLGLALHHLLVLGSQSCWRPPMALGPAGSSQPCTLQGFLLMKKETSEAVSHLIGPRAKHLPV